MRLGSMPSRAASRNLLLLWAVAAVVLIVSTIMSTPDRALLVSMLMALCLTGVRRHLLNWRRPRLSAHEAVVPFVSRRFSCRRAP